MAKITLSQVFIILTWGLILSFVFSVEGDVFDHTSEDDCEYCAVANHTVKVRILDESENLLAFKNKEPDCYKHYLVIPKVHIKNVHSEEATCELLKEMENFCQHLLDEDGITHGRKVLFHNPPFYAVKHLHLHCMACNENDESLLNLQYYINAFQSFASPDKCTQEVY